MTDANPKKTRKMTHSKRSDFCGGTLYSLELYSRVPIGSRTYELVLSLSRAREIIHKSNSLLESMRACLRVATLRVATYSYM